MLTRKQLYRKTIKNFKSKNKLIEKNNRYTDSQIDSTNRNPMNFILFGLGFRARFRAFIEAMCWEVEQIDVKRTLPVVLAYV